MFEWKTSKGEKMKILNGTEEFTQEVIKSEKPVLVDFFAEWCGPCKALIPTLDELSSELKDELKIVKIDVDQNSELATKYEIRGIPALFFFKNGEVKSFMSGLQSKESIIQEFNKITA